MDGNSGRHTFASATLREDQAHHRHPELIDIQKRSYDEFLQAEAARSP